MIQVFSLGLLSGCKRPNWKLVRFLIIIKNLNKGFEKTKSYLIAKPERAEGTFCSKIKF